MTHRNWLMKFTHMKKDDQTHDESETEEPRENEIEETKDSGDGNNNEEQKKFGIQQRTMRHTEVE